jgi:hypothetical protein
MFPPGYLLVLPPKKTPGGIEHTPGAIACNEPNAIYLDF